MAGLAIENWEVWLEQQFVSLPTWQVRLVDMSDSVEGLTLNLMNAGVRPAVLRNNTIFPIPKGHINDTVGQVALEEYDTETTYVTDLEVRQWDNGKLARDARAHAISLMDMGGRVGAFNLSPATAGVGKPKIKASGAAVGGRATLTFNDVADLCAEWDDAKVSEEGRVLVLSPQHKTDLLKEDRKFYNQISDTKTGVVAQFLGLDVYTYGDTAVYNATTGAKLAFGSSTAAGVYKSSFAFQATCALQAWKPVKGFYKLGDPDTRRDEIGFKKYGIIMPVLDMGFGVLYS